MGLRRRTVLGGIGTAAASTLAGCLGGGLEIDDVDARTTSFGNVILTVAVSNGNGSSEDGTLVGQVDMSGGDTYTERRDVTVTGDGSNTYELEFDIAISESLSAAEYEYSAELE